MAIKFLTDRFFFCFLWNSAFLDIGKTLWQKMPAGEHCWSGKTNANASARQRAGNKSVSFQSAIVGGELTTLLDQSELPITLLKRWYECIIKKTGLSFHISRYLPIFLEASYSPTTTRAIHALFCGSGRMVQSLAKGRANDEPGWEQRITFTLFQWPSSETFAKNGQHCVTSL